MKRDAPVSFEECFIYILWLSSGAFPRHPLLFSVAFDLCAKRKIVNYTTVRSRNRPEEFEKIGKLTREEVVHALEGKKPLRTNKSYRNKI